MEIEKEGNKKESSKKTARKTCDRSDYRVVICNLTHNTVRTKLNTVLHISIAGLIMYIIRFCVLNLNRYLSALGQQNKCHETPSQAHVLESNPICQMSNRRSNPKVLSLLFLLLLTNIYIPRVNETSRDIIMPTLTNLPPIARLSSKVIRILGCNPGPLTLQGTNSYLVGTGHRRVLVDSTETKTADTYIKLLKNVLNEEKATIEHLVITHWHHDHIGGVEPVRNLLKTLFPSDKQPTVWKLPRSSNQEKTDDEKSIQWEPLRDDQVVEVEGAKLQVKYTPGHTSDHACLLLQDENILFSGDCILGEGTSVFEDLHDYMLSLDKILQMRPKTIYPGHGPVLNDPLPHIQYYINHRKQREEDILRVLEEQGNDKSMTGMDIVKLIYKDTPENLWIAAAFTVNHHLHKLQKEGKVLQEQEGGWWIIKSKI